MVESLTIERVKGLLRLPTCPVKNLKGHLEIINGGKGSFIARDKPLLLYPSWKRVISTRLFLSNS